MHSEVFEFWQYPILAWGSITTNLTDSAAAEKANPHHDTLNGAARLRRLLGLCPY